MSRLVTRLLLLIGQMSPTLSSDWPTGHIALISVRIFSPGWAGCVWSPVHRWAVSANQRTDTVLADQSEAGVVTHQPALRVVWPGPVVSSRAGKIHSTTEF